jgi:hypothetical protein
MKMKKTAARKETKADRAMKKLTARAQSLKAEIGRKKRISPGQQRALKRLAKDVEAYNRSTGRFDIGVERAAFSTGAAGRAAFSAFCSKEPPQRCCDLNCPAIPPNRPDGYLCWLELDQSYCDSLQNLSVCSYKCIRFDSIPVFW